MTPTQTRPSLLRRRLRGTPFPTVGFLLLTVSVACSESPTAAPVRLLSISPEVGLISGLGNTVRFQPTALGDAGAVLSTETATWSTRDPGIATVDDRGTVTAVAMGTTRVTVSMGGLAVSSELEVYVPAPVAQYTPGVSYFGRADYIEYIPGELPVILSAPHGGDLLPAEMANRTFGTLVTDTNTRELTHAVREAFIDLTGQAPHVVISHLDRSKLDPNRDIEEAAQGDPFSEQAWKEFHAFIELARANVTVLDGGMYFDMHGHGHPKERLELGYLLSAEQLGQPDILLNSLAVVQMSSIREIGRTQMPPLAELLRGATSLGGFLEAEGVPAVPSPSDPTPGSDPYFTGGYNTRRHGSLADSEVVSGIQIEHHFPGLRDTDLNRRTYAGQLARAVRNFMLEHFGYFES